MKDTTCCFTGHRPEKLKCSESEVCEALEREIRIAFLKGYTDFISGMAYGVDLWAAEIVLKLKTEGLPVKLICALPYNGFERRWSAEWKKRYQEVLSQANEVNAVCEHYFKGCFQIRNMWMVDRSSLVLAVYNGEKGGTRNTVRYAERVGTEVIRCIV